MAKPSTRTTGNDKPADPGGTRPANQGKGSGKPKTAENNVKSADRNHNPAKSENKIRK